MNLIKLAKSVDSFVKYAAAKLDDSDDSFLKRYKVPIAFVVGGLAGGLIGAKHGKTIWEKVKQAWSKLAKPKGEGSTQPTQAPQSP